MISIHQSQFLPWLPYFYKIVKSDVFVIMDDVQYQKNGVQNRNQILTPQGIQWLTVPISGKFGLAINEVEIASAKALQKILKTLEANYKKAKFFEEVYFPVCEVVNKYNTELSKLNENLIKVFLDLLEIDTKILYSSSFETTAHKGDLVLELILKSNESEYITGKGALEYMDLDLFSNSGIRVYLSNFKYVPYKQVWNKNGFVDSLSIIDLLFNQLDTAFEYIVENGSVERVI